MRSSSRSVWLFLGCLLCGAPRAHAQADVAPAEQREGWAARSPLRLVPPPPGALLQGAGGSNSADFDEWHQRIGTELAPAAVIEHYVQALTSKGWTFDRLVLDGSVAVITGNSVEDAGVSRHALLLAARSATQESRVDLMLRLTARASDAPAEPLASADLDMHRIQPSEAFPALRGLADADDLEVVDSDTLRVRATSSNLALARIVVELIERPPEASGAASIVELADGSVLARVPLEGAPIDQVLPALRRLAIRRLAMIKATSSVLIRDSSEQVRAAIGKIRDLEREEP